MDTTSPWPNADLTDWLAKYPLPEGVEDVDLNMAETAQLFRVSSNAVKDWLSVADDPMPYVVKGAPGREYVLRFSWCWAWRQKREAAEKDRADRLARMQATLFSVPQEADQEALTPKQVKEAAGAALEYARAERELRRLAPMTDVYSLLEQLMVAFRDASMGMPDRLERELTLTPAQTRMVERAYVEMLEGLMVTIQNDMLGADFDADLDMDPQLVVNA